jgi:hypothetical protein
MYECIPIRFSIILVTDGTFYECIPIRFSNLFGQADKQHALAHILVCVV